MLLPTWSTEIPVSTHPAVNRSDVAAVVVNLTVTEALAGGYVSATTAGANRPENRYRSTSTLNVQRAGQTLANHAIVPVSARGFDVFAERGGHVIADTAGFFQGTPAPAPFPGPANSDPTPLFCEGFPAQPVSAVGRGSVPGEVVKVQTRLRQLSFWNFAVDGSYGLTTSQAVMAFQKWKGLPATARVDEATAVALNTTLCRPTAGQAGDLLEVNKTRQIAHVVRDGRVVWTFNVSTGNGQSYDEEDQRNAGRRAIGIAITPTGTFRTYREYDVPRYEGTLGTLYRPKFVVGGIAVHGASNVPNYPASHGCIRVVNPVMDLIWRDNLLPLRSTVWIHD
jgi:lipoprotein-anchoring transpeptidase ErfK/SrfK